MANSKVTLYYFDFNGRAESIRLLLHYAGKKFEDKRFTREQWPEFKPKSPFGQSPFVEIDGKVYGQSLAILNFFAREFNLFGKTNIDALRIEQFEQLIEDFIQEAAKSFREPDEEKKAELTKKVKEEVAPKFLGFTEKLLEQNGGKFMVGDGYTVADLIVLDLRTGFLASYTEAAFEKCPKTKVLAEKLASNERIKAYRAAHP